MQFINQIFSKEINVIDKPDILKGLGSTPFDSEGVQSKELKIIENGILKNYLIDTYNGKKVSFLGITYKSFTNTLTGSLTLSIAEELIERGCVVKAFDPIVSRRKSYLYN